MLATDVQNEYNHLYPEVRRFIWPFDTVEALVELEEAVYRAIPDIQEIRRAFSRFNSLVIQTARDDDTDYFEKALQRFQDLIENDDQIFCKLENAGGAIPQ